MGLIGASRKFVLNTLSALTLAWSSSLASCSPGTVENDFLCDETGCQHMDKDRNQEWKNSPTANTSSLESTIASSQGQAFLFDQQVQITDEFGQHLPHIQIYGHQSDQATLILAVDPSGAHYPSFYVAPIPFRQHAQKADSTDNFAQQASPLESEDFLTLVMKTYQWGKEIMSTLTSTEGEVLSEQDDLRTYCLTAEQMKNNYVLIPAGILVLTSADGLTTKMLHFAQGAFVNEVFNTYIKMMYGEQSGYLVSVPKQTTNLCGSDDGSICIISTESLSRQIWSKQEIPYWEIQGSCTPSLLGQYKEANQK